MTSVSNSSLPSKPQPQISKPPIKEGTTRYLYLFIHSFLLFYLHSFLPLRHCIVLQLKLIDWWLASITSITIQCRIFYYVYSWLLRTVRRRTLRSVARSVASARGEEEEEEEEEEWTPLFSILLFYFYLRSPKPAFFSTLPNHIV